MYPCQAQGLPPDIRMAFSPSGGTSLSNWPLLSPVASGAAERYRPSFARSPRNQLLGSRLFTPAALRTHAMHDRCPCWLPGPRQAGPVHGNP